MAIPPFEITVRTRANCTKKNGGLNMLSEKLLETVMSGEVSIITLLKELGLEVKEKVSILKVTFENVNKSFDRNTLEQRGGSSNLIRCICETQSEDLILAALYKMGISSEKLLNTKIMDFNEDLCSVDFKEISYSNFIGDNLREAFESDSQNILVISDTGSGKTEATVRGIDSLREKAVMLTPYSSQTEQCSIKYGKTSVIGGTGKKGFLTEDPQNFLFCVYDKFYDLFKEFEEKEIDISEYILIIDEYHQAIWDNDDNFRGKSLENILALKKHFKKVVYLSASPFGLDYSEFDEIYKFKPFNKKEHVKEFSQVLEVGELGLELSCDTFLDFVKTNHKDGEMDIILVESKEKVEEIAKNKILEDWKNGFVHSENKADSDINETIINQEKIPADYDLVTMTSLYKSAINIKNKNIGNVYIVINSRHKNSKYDLLYQFPARFREGINRLYIVNAGKEYYKKISDFSLPILECQKETIKSKIDSVDKFCQRENSGGMTNYNLKISSSKYRKKHFTEKENLVNSDYDWCPFDKKYITRKYKIINDIMTDAFHYPLLYNDEEIHKILRHIGIEKIEKTLTIHSPADLKNVLKSKTDFIHNLEQDYEYVLRTYKKDYVFKNFTKLNEIAWEKIPPHYRHLDKNRMSGSYKKCLELVVEELIEKRNIIDKKTVIMLMRQTPTRRNKWLDAHDSDIIYNKENEELCMISSKKLYIDQIIEKIPDSTSNLSELQNNELVYNEIEEKKNVA
jgi:hypothetical protein